MSRSLWALLNLITVLAVIAINYLSMAQRWNDTSISEVSNASPNLFTPAGYAFSIWGIIFLAISILCITLISKAQDTKEIEPPYDALRWDFILANILNASWLVSFIYGYYWLSVAVMFGILIFLHRILFRLIAKRPLKSWVRNMVLIPISLYAGWISVASIANTAFVLSNSGWTGSPLSPVVWTIVMIIIAALLHLYMVSKYRLSAYSAVGVWALAAIAVRHNGSMDSLFYTAFIGAILIAAAIIRSMVSRKTR